MYLIVGLGNPGKEYELTRHNMGFRAIDSLANDLGIKISKTVGSSLTGQGSYEATKVVLAKPQTFMNLSGESVRELMNWFKIGPDHLIVINDDLDLEPGSIRVKEKGNSAGHKGVDSVIERIGTTAFVRIRVGIGRESLGGDNSRYVLQSPDKSQMEVVDTSIIAASEAVRMVIKDGVDAAMNKFNGT